MAKKKNQTKNTKKASYLVIAAILVVVVIFLAGYMNPPKAPEAPKEETPPVVTDAGFAKACQMDTDGTHNFFECTSNAIGMKYVDRPTATQNTPRTYYSAQGSKIYICGGSEHLAIECLNLDSLGATFCTKAISCP